MWKTAQKMQNGIFCTNITKQPDRELQGTYIATWFTKQWLFAYKSDGGLLSEIIVDRQIKGAEAGLLPYMEPSLNSRQT